LNWLTLTSARRGKSILNKSLRIKGIEHFFQDEKKKWSEVAKKAKMVEGGGK